MPCQFNAKLPFDRPETKSFLSISQSARASSSFSILLLYSLAFQDFNFCHVGDFSRDGKLRRMVVSFGNSSMIIEYLFV